MLVTKMLTQLQISLTGKNFSYNLMSAFPVMAPTKMNQDVVNLNLL